MAASGIPMSRASLVPDPGWFIGVQQRLKEA